MLCCLHAFVVNTMNDLKIIAELFRHNDQANRIVLEASADLSDAQLDRALDRWPAIERFLQQDPQSVASSHETVQALQTLLAE